MAAAKAAPPDADAADAPSAEQSPPTPESLYKAVADLIRRVSPGAVNPRLVWDVPGNSVPASIPLIIPRPELSELAGEILDQLERVGGWVNGAALAKLVDEHGTTDHTHGNFKRAVDDLKGHGLIETCKRKGYRAK